MFKKISYCRKRPEVRRQWQSQMATQLSTNLTNQISAELLDPRRPKPLIELLNAIY